MRHGFARPIQSASTTLLSAVVVLAAASSPLAEDVEGFRSLFNGKDLTGWDQVNCAKETFTVRDGLIFSTGMPSGFLRSDRHYENFILELQWRHLKPRGNAGLFVWSDPLPAPGSPFTRCIEVQILDGRNTENYTSHGDVFGIQGATMKPDRPHPGGWMRCLPSERRCRPTGEWNHYRIECRDGVIKLAVNGKVVSGARECNPRKGYVCLESEGSPVEFRNIRIKELPTTGAPSEETAELDQGFRLLYSGLDLRGWKRPKGHEDHWRPKGHILSYDGKSEADDKHLWTEESFGDFVLRVDWRLTGKPKPTKRPLIHPNGEYVLDGKGNGIEKEVPDAGDSGIYLRGNSKSQVNIWCWPIGSGEVYGYRNDPKQSADVRAGVTPRERADHPIGKWNRFVITMKGDRLTVVLNGKTVIENAQLPGVPERGPIALQHHGDAIDFANLFIKRLD